MRLLIASLYYAPEQTGNAPYVTGLAEHLASRGHTVDVIAGLPHYPAWRRDDRYAGRRWLTEAVNGVSVHRRWHSVPRRQTALQRALYEVTFLVSGLSGLALRKPDAVLGVVPSLSSGVLARLLGRRFGMPYGVIFQDLMGPAALQSGVEGGARAAGIVRAAERWIAAGARRVGIAAEGFRPYLAGQGVPADRIARVRNWTHVDAERGDGAAFRAQHGISGDAFVCLHSGNMGLKQGLETVLEAARLAAQTDPELFFLLAGDGNQRAQLQQLASRYGLANLRFLPTLNDASFFDALAAADALVVSQRTSVSDMSLPSKLTSYFAAARPIVASVALDSETARELRASGAALVVPAASPDALGDALLTLRDDAALRAKLAEGGRAYAQAHLRPESALAGLERFVAEIAEPMPDPGYGRSFLKGHDVA